MYHLIQKDFQSTVPLHKYYEVYCPHYQEKNLEPKPGFAPICSLNLNSLYLNGNSL